MQRVLLKMCLLPMLLVIAVRVGIHVEGEKCVAKVAAVLVGSAKKITITNGRLVQGIQDVTGRERAVLTGTPVVSADGAVEMGVTVAAHQAVTGAPSQPFLQGLVLKPRVSGAITTAIIPSGETDSTGG